MPFEYAISPQERLVCITASGPVEAEQSFAVCDAVAADPDFRRGFRVSPFRHIAR